MATISNILSEISTTIRQLMGARNAIQNPVAKSEITIAIQELQTTSNDVSSLVIPPPIPTPSQSDILGQLRLG